MFDSESPLERRLLDALNDDEHPAPAEVRARVRARLETAIPAMRGGAGTGGHGGGSSSPVTGIRSAPLLGRGLTVVAAFAMGAVTGAALYAGYAKSPGAHRDADSARPVAGDMAPPPASVGRVSITRRLDDGDSQRASYAEPASSAPAPVMGRSPGLGRSVRSSSPPSTEVSQIDAERIVLDEARAGLIQGDPERALAHIETHRTKYPEGFLAEERDAMQVEALARAGRYEDARRAAARFRARRPSSMYTSTVDDAIASIP